MLCSSGLTGGTAIPGLRGGGTPQGGECKAVPVVLTVDIMMGVCWSLELVEKGWPCRCLWGVALPHIISCSLYRSCSQLGSCLPDLDCYTCLALQGLQKLEQPFSKGSSLLSRFNVKPIAVHAQAHLQDLATRSPLT